MSGLESACTRWRPGSSPWRPSRRGFSLTEAAELAGCSRTAVVNWAKAAGVAPPPRKKAVYLPFDRKMELVARLEAGERAADLAAEAGVTAAAVSAGAGGSARKGRSPS